MSARLGSRDEDRCLDQGSGSLFNYALDMGNGNRRASLLIDIKNGTVASVRGPRARSDARVTNNLSHTPKTAPQLLQLEGESEDSASHSCDQCKSSETRSRVVRKVGGLRKKTSVQTNRPARNYESRAVNNLFEHLSGVDGACRSNNCLVVNKNFF